jgi:HSP20 family protein
MVDINNETDVKEKSVSLEEVLEKEPAFAPYVNIYETADEFVLTANMPGVSKDDVKLKLEEGVLTIFGKGNFEEDVNRKYILNETGFGNYYREFKISNSIDESKIDAKYENGQLVVKLPKHDRIKPRTISVK